MKALTNGEWINNMALIDFLTLINQNSVPCVLSLLNVSDCDLRCKEFSDEEKDVDDVCYNCACKWLNENFQKKF